MKRERGMESERGAALAVHITLLTIRGQCHRVRPAAPLHFTWLHLAPPLRFSPACPPPPRFASLPPCSPSRLLTPDGFSRPLVSLATRARDRESPAPRPPSFLSSSFYLRPLRLLLYRRLLSRVSTSPSSSLPALSSCSWLPVPPRPPPPSILIDRSCTRARSASPHHLVSSPSTRSRSSLSSVLCSFFFLFPLSFCLLSFRRLFFLRLLFEPPPPPFGLADPLSLSARARGINYSKNLYCYYYRLTIPSALKPETCTRVQYNARLCSRPADYVNPTTARATTATTATTGRRCLVSLW